MQKLITNKIFIGTVCLLLAAVLSFVLLPKLYEDETATVQVVVLNCTAEKGTVITEEMLKTVEVGALGLSGTVATTKEQVLGMVAASTIYPGEYLTKNRLLPADDYKGDGTALQNGQYLLSLKLPSPAAGLAGVLRGGDCVDVYTTLEDENGIMATQKVLTNISVVKVFNTHLESLDTLDKQASQDVSGVKSSNDYAPVYIVVRVDESQAKALISLEHSENFHLSLAKAGD